MKTKQMLYFVVFLLLALSACSPAASSPMATASQVMAKTPEAMMSSKTPEMMKENTPDAMMATKPSDDMMATKTPDAMMATKASDDMMKSATPDAMKAKPTSEAMMGAPAWIMASLTDVRTGKGFKISDFKGKVIVVENMATWCPNCLQQQKQVVLMLSQLASKDQIVMIGIDIDLNEDSAMLKTYIEKQGFNWNYAVASADIAREMGNLYGDQFLNPSSTPMLIIDTHGAVHPLPFGIKNAETLKKMIEQYLSM